MSVAILKTGAGNVRSVAMALQRLGAEPILTDDAREIMLAEKVVFPGQGEARHTMAFLCARGLDELIRSLRQPVLGICIGQQLLCRHSDEGDVDCLGIFDVDVKRFAPAGREKVPHMGWDTLSRPAGKLFDGISDGEYVYFVHSFYVPLCPFTTAATDYITPFSAALAKDNFYAVQFHPEKSGEVGERILRNFLAL
ncbi:MAG: imidazole glycerol phosphate synthase subunit HisH [Prevotella sp.]|nr:imidazole glycerol phosphate synthase subunit HisH [Prevotella sp.]